MRRITSLSPSLHEIGNRLFGISDGLIRAVEEGKTSSRIADSVKRSNEWREHQSVYQTLTPGSSETEPSIQQSQMPDHLKNLIQRRVAARATHSVKSPMQGQIVQVTHIKTPRDGQIDWVMMVPLYVLLDEPAESKLLWHGWLVSGESDYAGWWDYVLQEQDEPFDPEAAMIQIWNPVRLFIPMAGSVVGQLNPMLMQAVRSLASDYILGEVPAHVPVWPGRVAGRTTSHGFHIATGSPYGREGVDPRHEYRQLYIHAAEAIKAPARLALEELSALPAGRIGKLFSNLIAGAGFYGGRIWSEPRVAIAMSQSSSDPKGDFSMPDLIWEGLARIRIKELKESGGGSIEVSAEGNEDISVEIICEGIVDDHAVALTGKPPVQFAWDSDEMVDVSLTASGGNRVVFPISQA